LNLRSRRVASTIFETGGKSTSYVGDVPVLIEKDAAVLIGKAIQDALNAG